MQMTLLHGTAANSGTRIPTAHVESCRLQTPAAEPAPSCLLRQGADSWDMTFAMTCQKLNPVQRATQQGSRGRDNGQSFQLLAVLLRSCLAASKHKQPANSAEQRPLAPLPGMSAAQKCRARSSPGTRWAAIACSVLLI